MNTGDNEFLLEVVSPMGIVYAGQVSSVSAPAYEGQIMVLPHHAPLFTRLTGGEVEIDSSGRPTTIVIAGGFLEVNSGKVHILSDYAVRAESIEQASTLERKRKAEEKLKGKLSNEEFTTADKELKLSILELKVAEKIKRKHRP